MGAISNERRRHENEYRRSAGSDAASARVQSMSSSLDEEEALRKQNQLGITKYTKKMQLPATLLGAGARVADMSNPGGAFSSLLQAVYLGSKGPGVLTGQDQNNASINKYKTKKATVDNGTVSGGGARQIASNAAGISQSAMKLSGGAYALGAGANLAGFNGTGAALTAAGKYGFMNNPLASSGSFLANQAGGGTFSPGALPGYLASKTGTAVTGLGNMMGPNLGGGGVAAAGKGISGLADMFGGGATSSMVGMAAMLAATMGGQKVMKGISGMGGVNKSMNTGKSIRAVVQNGLKVFDKYFTGRGIESIHNMYQASGVYKSPFEGLMISLGLVMAKSLAGLPAIYEVLVGKGEGSRVGANLAQNDHQSKFGTSKDSLAFSSKEETGDEKKGFGHALNKFGVELEGKILKTQMALNPFNWLSMKNNPIALMRKMDLDSSVNDAKKTVAARNGTSIQFLTALETTFASSTQGGNTVEEKILLATMHIGEIIRGESLQRKRANGKALLGQVGEQYDADKKKRSNLGIDTMDDIANMLGHIPILGPIIGLTFLGGKNAMKFKKMLSSGAKSLWSGFTGKGILGESKKSFSIAKEKSPQELMYLYLGKTFPDRFEKLLDKAHDRNNFIKEVAKKLGVSDDKLKDSSSGAKWIGQFGKMMTANDLDSKLKSTASSQAKGKFLELMDKSNWYTKLVGGHKARKNIRGEAEKDKESIFGKYFGAGASGGRTADDSQNRVVQDRHNDEAIQRSKDLVSHVSGIQETLEKLLDCCLGGAGAGAGDDDDSPGWMAGMAGMLGLTTLWNTLKNKGKAIWSAIKGGGTAAGKTGISGLLARVAPLFRVLGPAFAIFDMIYHWEDIWDWGKEKVGNILDGDFAQLFGTEAKDGTNIAGETYKFGGDASKTLWYVASTAALLFPNPFTLGFAALAGIYHYGPDLLSAGRSALEWAGIMDPEGPTVIDKERDASIKANRAADRKKNEAVAAEMRRIAEETKKKKQAATSKTEATTTTGKMIQVGGEVYSNSTGRDYMEAGGYGSDTNALKIKHPKPINLKLLNKETQSDVLKMLAMLREESDTDKSNSINTTEEFEIMAKNLVKHQKEFRDINTAGQQALIDSINSLGQIFNVGQQMVAQTTSDAVGGLKIEMVEQSSWKGISSPQAY